VYTQPPLCQSSSISTAATLLPHTQPPQPPVPTCAVTAETLPSGLQTALMSSAVVHSATTQPGLVHSLDAQTACTQPPLLRSSSMPTTGVQPAYTQPSHCQPVPTYMMGSQPVSVHPLQTPTEVIHAPTGAQYNWPVHLGLPSPGYPLFPEGGLVGSVHAPSPATPAQNYFIDGTQGQTVAPMADDKILHSLLPGLPTPPTSPVVFRQSSAIPVTATTGLSVSSGPHHMLSMGSAATVTSSVSGQSATAATVPSSVSTTTAVAPTSGQPMTYTTTSAITQTASVSPSTVSAAAPTSTTTQSTSAAGTSVATVSSPATTTGSSTSSAATTTTPSTTSEFFVGCYHRC